tara:strand:- start:5883 stop:6080 length:198 start_codon:yes stop_codon:yes gene_type:complete
MSLNKKQKKAVWTAFKTLRFVNHQISECHDLWLSDCRDLELAQWTLQQAFDEISDKVKEEQNART